MGVPGKPGSTREAWGPKFQPNLASGDGRVGASAGDQVFRAAAFGRLGHVCPRLTVDSGRPRRGWVWKQLCAVVAGPIVRVIALACQEQQRLASDQEELRRERVARETVRAARELLVAQRGISFAKAGRLLVEVDQSRRQTVLQVAAEVVRLGRLADD